MSASAFTPRTPITIKANRGEERVRLLEEAVLLIRGEWPAIAYGLCESVNRASGLIFASSNALQEAINETVAEALRLVESLYGRDAVLDIQRLAVIGPEPQVSPPAQGGTLSRVRPPSRWRRRLRLTPADTF